MSRYRLNWYELTEEDSGDWFVKFPLGDVYSILVDQAFPKLNHIGWRTATKGVKYTYVKQVSTSDIRRLRKFLDLLKWILVLRLNKNLEPHFEDELDQCFALDFNLEHLETRTGAGELEYQAKYKQSKKCIEKLIELLANVCSLHPNLEKVDYVAAVPGNPGKDFHLPDQLVRGMGKLLGRDVGLDLRKAKTTPQLKDLPLKKKIAAMNGVFSLNENVEGQSVLLVDDLYQSGTTMWTLARFLKENDAERVYGLTCVKSWRDSDNI